MLAANGLTDAVDVHYLPANLHNRPEQIVPALRTLIGEHVVDDPERSVLLGYADCGTGGHIDALVAEMPQVRRLPGAHCYELFAGAGLFASLHDEQPGTFYLTDFLAKHFDALVWQGLGLDRHPELRPMYFGNYTRLVLLSQATDEAQLDGLVATARDAADRLGLAFEHRNVGLGPFAEAVTVSLKNTKRRAA